MHMQPFRLEDLSARESGRALATRRDGKPAGRLAEANGSWLRRVARLPLALLPPTMVVPILAGKLRGRRWIVGSALHRCWLGVYESGMQRKIAREVRPSGVFWDIGANVGFYSLLASKLVGAGKVFAFEPAPRNVSYLKKHLALNRASNVEVLAIAVSDRNGVASFAAEETGFMGRLSGEGSLAVLTATVDSLVAEGKALPPDYVKMDIEGAELLALHGGRETFQRFRPVLFLATHGKEVGKECRRLLESWGYECRSMMRTADSELGELVAKFREQKQAKDQAGGATANGFAKARSGAR